MGNCITNMLETSLNTMNIDCNTIATTTKSKKMVDKYELYETKVLQSKGKLELPHGLEWFPTGHGHTRVKQLFELKCELGCGVTGAVYSAVYKGKKCAIKRIKKNGECEVAIELVTSEGRILRNLKHNGIINLIDMFFDNDYYYLIMERANYDLFSWISISDWVSESICAEIVRRLFESLKYLHDRNIVHRDLKPENIVFCKHGSLQPKIIDFGDAMYIKNDKIYDEYVGTPQYMSKERYVLHKGWELKKSDIFALGVITYEMVARQRCFDGATQEDIYKQVSNGELKWPNHVNISRECKEFVEWCLSTEAKDRPWCEQALSHCWLMEQKTHETQNWTERLKTREMGVNKNTLNCTEIAKTTKTAENAENSENSESGMSAMKTMSAITAVTMNSIGDGAISCNILNNKNDNSYQVININANFVYV